MAVVGYITYSLLNIAGSGYQPHQQVASQGMGFEGGHFSIGNRMLAYLIGDSGDVSNTVASLNAWLVQELTPSEALAWADDALPVNTVVEDVDGGTQYVGPAEFDAEGRINKPLSDVMWP